MGLDDDGCGSVVECLEDLENIDFVSVGLTEEDRVSMINQLNVLAASFYLDGLDMFGGMPLYTSTKEDVKARATDVETSILSTPCWMYLCRIFR